jgi:type 1 glutamine amidotransferase
MLTRTVVSLALTFALGFISLSAHAQQQFKVLLFSKTAGFHHESINEGVTAIRQLAVRNHFGVDWHEDSSVFNDQRLAQYQAIIFLCTTGDILNDEQQAAMERFIRSGKGFVGIHSASDTEYDWEWYTKMVGRTFHIHPVIQTAELTVTDRKFPGFERMPDRFLWTDEWYEFGAERIKGLNYILAVDADTFDPTANWGVKKNESKDKSRPVAWYHNYDGGRAFYTALGHVPATFSDQAFLDHIFGGVYWAATGKGLRKR